jgi:methylisocitrate lyase
MQTGYPAAHQGGNRVLRNAAKPKSAKHHGCARGYVGNGFIGGGKYFVHRFSLTLPIPPQNCDGDAAANQAKPCRDHLGSEEGNNVGTEGQLSPGARFRSAVEQEHPLQVIGAINAYTARMAQATGFRALYLSGGGVAANSLGLPDLGISSMEDVLVDVRRITEVTTLPLLVDIDTGWGGAFNIARTIRSMQRAGAAAVHMEDQVGAKRCGHRPGKELVPAAEMVDRIKAAVDARTDPDFVIMARTDALAGEGLAAALDRSAAYVAAGADMIFAEAVTELPMYARFKETAGVPILANITEFGKTPLYTRQELAAAGVDIILYCCAAYRAMNAAALKVYHAIRTEGTQSNVLSLMQTRAELYEFLGYDAYEQKLDQLFEASKRS